MFTNFFSGILAGNVGKSDANLEPILGEGDDANKDERDYTVIAFILVVVFIAAVIYFIRK